MFTDNSLWIWMEGNALEAPLFRREFAIEGDLAAAKLVICGLGYYEAFINGKRVGDHVLDPAQTDYEERIFYVTHEVADLLHPGLNVIGVVLGNGWFNQNQVWAKGGLPYGQPRLRAEVHLQFRDGRTTILGTDPSWRCAPGPVTANNVYAGERYDARLKQTGWNVPGFVAAGWKGAGLAPVPGGRLEEQRIPPIRRIEEITPKSIMAIEDDRFIVDMGQNFSGWARIRVTGPRGTNIRMRFGETLSEQGRLDTASTGVKHTHVEQVDTYICEGKGEETWEPGFTYHGFRYMEIAGWPGIPDTSQITGVVVHTDLPEAGKFTCSDSRLNRLHEMALWTHRSNIHGIPEDCPARERCGWLGDANLVAEFSFWNYNGKSFWEKYLDDIETTRKLNGGLPCNIAPGKRTCGTANPDWAAVLIMLPWYLYLHYGDGTVFRRHWEGMRHLMEHFIATSEDGILEGGFGDWFDPGGESCCTHTPPTLTTTIWFYACAQVMGKAARVIGESQQATGYEEGALRIKDAFNKQFLDTSFVSYGSQTANAMALHFGLVPDGLEKGVVDALLKDIRDRDFHLNTGIMGIRVIFEVLTEHGHGEVALKLMHQNTYPSFGDWIRRGATTLWEYWGEPLHDQQRGARSLNHPMMGGYDNWFFNTLGGIRPDPEHPGFEKFFLRPRPIPGLDWVECRHHSPHGEIVSNWNKADKRFNWSIEIPAGTRATVEWPYTGKVAELGEGKHQLSDPIPAPADGRMGPD